MKSLMSRIEIPVPSEVKEVRERVIDKINEKLRRGKEGPVLDASCQTLYECEHLLAEGNMRRLMGVWEGPDFDKYMEKMIKAEADLDALK
jgi:hypothetical protein